MTKNNKAQMTTMQSMGLKMESYKQIKETQMNTQNTNLG